MMLRPLSASRGVIVCFPGRGERRPHYPCVFMCGQTHRSPNGSFAKPQYSSIHCLFRKCSHGNETDTFCGKFKDCDVQEMGG